MTTDNPDDELTVAPEPGRVASRALVLSAVAFRGWLEEHANDDRAQSSHEALLLLLSDFGLYDELEPEELRWLRMPIGTADQQETYNANWRAEGAAVLAWALGRYDLPPHDQNASFSRVCDGLGFLDPEGTDRLLRSPSLRPREEISAFASEITIIRWRMTQFRIDPHPMDFVGYLREHPSFRPVWLASLNLINGDLAFRGQSIANLPADVLRTCGSIALERQIAAYWLEGDSETYSKIIPSTFLIGC